MSATSTGSAALEAVQLLWEPLPFAVITTPLAGPVSFSVTVPTLCPCGMVTEVVDSTVLPLRLVTESAKVLVRATGRTTRAAAAVAPPRSPSR